jgi:hypothetical protein
VSSEELSGCVEGNEKRSMFDLKDCQVGNEESSDFQLGNPEISLGLMNSKVSLDQQGMLTEEDQRSIMIIGGSNHFMFTASFKIMFQG